MNTDIYKQEASVGSIDSFEVNMKQIEQTNKLLAGIESKLTDFFKHNETPNANAINSVTFEGGDRNTTADFDEELKAGRFILPEKDDYKLPTEANVLSPIPEKLGIHHFLSQGSAESRPSHFINVIDHPRQQDYNPYSPEFHSLGFVPQRDPSIRDPSIRDPKMEVQRFPSYSQVRSPQSYGLSLQDTNLLTGKNMYSEREKFDRIEDTLLGTGLKFNDSSSAGTGLVEKMNKLEDFYNNKIRLLEERLFNAEKQTQTLLKQNEALNIELTRLRRDQADSKSKYVEDLTKNLKEQEERIRREYESTLKNKDRSQEESSKQMEKFLETVDDLKYEKSRLNEELQHMKNLHQMTLDEKENLHRQYQSLLNMHNQMLQMDIQKNEKSLKDSQIQSDYRPSQTRFEQDQIRGLVEALGSYKQELDYLKENNNLIQRQFSFEIQRLKEELKSQKDENKQLNERLGHKESSRLLSPISPLSAKKPTREFDGRPTGEFMKDDDLSRLDRHELANYAKMVRENFIELEEKHRQTLQYNKNLQNNLKDIGQRSREDLEKLNEAFSNVYEGDSKSYNDISRHLSPRNQSDTLDGRKESVPFTNAQIKTTLMSTKEKKELMKETLEKDLGGYAHPDPQPKSSKSRSRVSTKEEDLEKVVKESKAEKENKRKKSFEDFTDELKRLKTLVNSKIVKKSTGSKTPRSSNTSAAVSMKAGDRKRSRSKSTNKKD